MTIAAGRRPATAAEHYLRVAWDSRRAFLLIIAISVAIAVALAWRQPTLYTSQALLSVKPPAELLAEAARTGCMPLAPDGRPYDANDPARQSGAGRYAPRVAAPGLVTLAARDAGLLGATAALDDRAAGAWVTAQPIEASDLIAVRATQATPAAAQKLAAAVIARAMRENEREEAGTPRSLQRPMAVIDAPTLPLSPSSPRPWLNFSVGLGIGVLAAVLFVSTRNLLRG